MQPLTTKKFEANLKVTPAGNYQLLIDKTYLKIFISTAGNFLIVDWNGLPSKENIMEGCEQILEFVKKFGLKKIINDVSHVERPFSEVVEWVVLNFSPRLNASGIEYVAWIYSESSEGRKSADAIVANSITDTIVIVFDNLENAERWIMAV